MNRLIVYALVCVDFKNSESAVSDGGRSNSYIPANRVIRFPVIGGLSLDIPHFALSLTIYLTQR